MYTDFCGWYPYYWCNYITSKQVRQMLNCYQEIESSMAIDKINHYYYADNLPVYALEDCPKATKVDIFETLNLLIFPYDPIRDWTKKKVTEINERFKPLEKALGI